MYKLLVVDDESIVADMLVELFEAEMSLELEVYKAYSASEAMAWLEKVKMDIVLSDIKMPGMNGLELLERIKLSWQDCKVVFLTGFREFDYVYSAIQNGVARYLLKTEEDNKIIETIREVICEIEISLHDNEINDKAKLQMEKVLPLLQKEYLQSFVDGFSDEPIPIQNRFNELKIPLNTELKAFMFIGRFDSLPVGISSSRRDELHYALKSLAIHYIPEFFNQICFLSEQTFFVGLVQTTAKEAVAGKHMQILRGALEYIQKSCGVSLKMTISFAMSSELFLLANSSEEYRKLRQLLGYRIGIVKEMILSDKNFIAAESQATFSSKHEIKMAYRQLKRLKMLENYMESGQKNEFIELFGSIVNCLQGVISRDDNEALEIYFSVANLLLSYMNRWNLSEFVASKLSLHSLLRIDEHKSWNEAVQYLKTLVEVIFEIQSNEEYKRAEDVINALQQFISANLSGDLSLTRLADRVSLNSSYLSRLFKQVTNKNISDYITEVRIEKAKILLNKSSKKISEISAEVGYESQQSFTRFFKNAVGISPYEYRER